MSLRNFEGRKEFLSKAEAYLDQDLPDMATALAQERLDRFPGDVDARIIIGSSLVKMGKMEEAIEILRNVKDDILNWSRVFEYLGDIYLEKGLTEKAIKNYQNFILLNSGSPTTEDVSLKLDSLTGSSYRDSILDEESVEDSEGGIEDVSPDFYTITLAELYKKQGHLEMSREVLEKILQADAGNIKAAEILEDVKTMLNGNTPKMLAEEKRASVISELNKWLINLNKMKENEPD
jgi:tetratricopeptide (TPR) repeat protein